MPTALSLFSGCGGDSLGLESAGFRLLGYVEIWKPAVESHRQNFPDCPRLGEDVGGDIRKISDADFRTLTGKVDLLFAGFPCQGFSHAGKKDPNDPRNRLFWEFVRAASLIRPRWVVGENVSGLLHRTTDDGRTPVSEVIVGAFKDAGYRMAEPFVLDAADFGVPQKRARVFFVGSREGTPFRPPAPATPNRRQGVHGKRATVRSVVEFSLEGAIPFDPGKVEGGVRSFVESEGREKPTGTPHPYLVQKMGEGLASFGKRVSPFHVEVADLDAPTKTIHSGYSFQPRLFVPLRNKAGTFLRPFTPGELSRLQGFPADFSLCGGRAAAIVQAGNAVPPPLVRAVAAQIVACDDELSARSPQQAGLRAWEERAPTPAPRATLRAAAVP